MEVVDVTERPVPGGRLREFTTKEGWIVSVVHEPSGRIELALRRPTADEVAVAANLSPAEGVALAALLTGAKVVVNDEGAPSTPD